MSKWQEKRLGEVVNYITRGITPKYTANGIKVINQKCIRDYKINLDFCKETLDTTNIGKKYVKYGDILINSTGTGTLGRVACSKIQNMAITFDSHVTLCRVGKEYNNFFIGYYLNSIEKELENFGRGSTNQTELNINDIKKIKINIPDIATQEKIADILSTYDDLIENNNRRIEILEKMAQEIYKEWFIRFRFPGHEKVKFISSKLGKLPQTFNVVNAETVFEFYIGGGWGNENISENFPIEANVIRGTDIPNVRKYDISSCPVRYHKIGNYKSRQLVSGDIVMEISGGTADQPVGRCTLITQELIDRFKNGNVICASFCKLIRLNKNLISPYFCYYWLQYLYDTRIIDRFQLQSTGIINFKFEAFLKKGLIMLPPMNIMLQFENYVKYIVQEINMLASQNQNLIKQRDLLLPRLMSGKLEV